MTLAGSIITGMLLLLGFANGLRRGGIKEGTALIGVLLGALLVEFWAQRWGQTLSERSGLHINNAVLLLSLALLIGTALFSGYGSGLFFRRTTMKSGERIAGALLGLLNMGLLTSFTLRYTQELYFNETDPTQPVQSWIRESIVSRFMLNWLGYVLLGAALTLGIVSIVMATLRLERLAATPRPPAKPAKPAPSASQSKPAQAAQPAPQGQALGQPKPADPGLGGAPAQPKMPAGQHESFIDRQEPRGGA